MVAKNLREFSPTLLIWRPFRAQYKGCSFRGFPLVTPGYLLKPLSGQRKKKSEPNKRDFKISINDFFWQLLQRLDSEQGAPERSCLYKYSNKIVWHERPLARASVLVRDSPCPSVPHF